MKIFTLVARSYLFTSLAYPQEEARKGSGHPVCSAHNPLI